MNLKGGTDDDEDLSALTPILGELHFIGWHRLAEGDVCAFEKTAAAIASGRRKVFAESFINGGRFKAPVTAEAGHEPVCAVDLNELFAGNTGDTMKAIDILCDEAEELAALLEVADRVVAGVRFDLFI